MCLRAEVTCVLATGKGARSVSCKVRKPPAAFLGVTVSPGGGGSRPSGSDVLYCVQVRGGIGHVWEPVGLMGLQHKGAS